MTTFNNIKKTWQGINSLISNNRKTKKPIIALKDPNTNTIIRNKSKLPGVKKTFCFSCAETSIPSSKFNYSFFGLSQTY